MLQLNLAMFLQLQGLVLYTYFKPFEEGVENFLAITTQLEILITVHFALLSHLSAVSLEHGDEATTIGAVLTAGVILITALVSHTCNGSTHSHFAHSHSHSHFRRISGHSRTLPSPSHFPSVALTFVVALPVALPTGPTHHRSRGLEGQPS